MLVLCQKSLCFSVTFGSFSASQLSALILAALSGDQAAVTMLVSFGENFVAGLLTDNLITQTQADQLLTLFTLATLTPPVITVGPPIIIPSPTPPIILPPVPPFQRSKSKSNSEKSITNAHFYSKKR